MERVEVQRASQRSRTIGWLLVAVFGLGAVWAGVAFLWPRPLDRTRVYRVGVDHAPPYNVIRPGMPIRGLAVDVITEAARRAGLRLQFVTLDIPVDEAFKRGLVDLWPAATDTPERRKWLHLARPWIANRLCIVSKEERPVSQLQDLAGMRVSMAYARIFKDVVRDLKLPGVEVKEIRGRRENLVALCRGDVEATVIEQRFLEQALQRRPAECSGTGLRVLNIPGADRMLTILAQKNAGAAADELRDQISGMVNDGTLSQVLESWSAFTGSEIRYAQEVEQAQARARLVALVLVSIVLFGLLLLWQNSKLRLANARAREAARVKSDFLASMSHEIRTPMNGIIGMADLILESPLNEDQHEHAQAIRNSANSLLRMINEILDYSKGEAGGLVMEMMAFSLTDVVRQGADLLRPSAQAKGLQLLVDVDERVPERLLGDPDRVRQVVLNLLGNAVKFTDRGSIALALKCINTTEQECGIVLKVKDSGIGIEPDKIPQLFTKFFQADASINRRYGGTGLGLAITKQLVQLMNGTIDVKSTPGSGTEFTVSMTFQLPVIAAEALGNSSSVLLVEDNAVNQKVARRLLERFGCRVKVADDGLEALSVLEREVFDLVLMDCQMPGIDGLTVTQRYREREVGRRTPIVAMTAADGSEDRMKCREAGMDGFLVKPVSVESMAEVLKQWSKNGQYGSSS